MVAQKTLLILTCIVGAYLLAVLVILVLPHVQYTWMLNETHEAMQTYADHMTAVCNYLIQYSQSLAPALW